MHPSSIGNSRFEQIFKYDTSDIFLTCKIFRLKLYFIISLICEKKEDCDKNTCRALFGSPM